MDKEYLKSELRNFLDRQNSEDDAEGKREGKLLLVDLAHLRSLEERNPTGGERYKKMMQNNLKYFEKDVLEKSHYKEDKKAGALIREAVGLLEGLAA